MSPHGRAAIDDVHGLCQSSCIQTTACRRPDIASIQQTFAKACSYSFARLSCRRKALKELEEDQQLQASSAKLEAISLSAAADFRDFLPSRALDLSEDEASCSFAAANADPTVHIWPLWCRCYAVPMMLHGSARFPREGQLHFMSLAGSTYCDQQSPCRTHDCRGQGTEDIRDRD